MTRARGIRIPDDVWQAARATADTRGETVSAAILAFLRRYGRDELLRQHAAEARDHGEA